MGELARAKIYVLSGDGGDNKSREDSNGIDVCFNPKEYSLDKSLNWNGDKSFTDAPMPELTKPQPAFLSVVLQFDTYEERVSVRDKYVKKIEKLSMLRGNFNDKLKPDQKKAAGPPVILFVWGNFTFKGVIETLSQKYTMFLSNGTPVRADVTLKIRNVLDAAFNDDEKFTIAAANTATREYVVQQGDRLDLIAAKMLNDASRWPEIAMLNDLDDPVALKVNQTLKIPG